MSDFDPETGRRIPDNDELADAADWRESRRRARLEYLCACGPDMARGCPGRSRCPMCEEDENVHQY